MNAELDLSFRKAEKNDAARIVSLVNSAYRGEFSKQGWTTEADLLDGPRTDEAEVTSLIQAECSMILLGLFGSELVASVHLEQVDDSAYLGMFAVTPRWQGGGIGKRLMGVAETTARSEWDVVKMTMSVITLRHDLIAFYERRGYRRTGDVKAFTYGIPKVENLQIELLEKELMLPAANRPNRRPSPFNSKLDGKGGGQTY